MLTYTYGPERVECANALELDLARMLVHAKELQALLTTTARPISPPEADMLNRRALAVFSLLDSIDDRHADDDAVLIAALLVADILSDAYELTRQIVECQ